MEETKESEFTQGISKNKPSTMDNNNKELYKPNSIKAEQIFAILQDREGPFKPNSESAILNTIKQLLKADFTAEEILGMDVGRIKKQAKWNEEREIIEQQQNKRFFEKNKLVASKLAEAIVEDYDFITLTDTEDIYYYHEGIYHPNGKIKIKEIAKQYVGDQLTSHNINEILLHLKINTYTDRKQIDNNRDLIHMENGIYDITKNSFYKFTPLIMTLSKIPLQYAPEASCPKIKQFLKEILEEEDIEVIQELFGYFLLKNYNIQRSFMFTGEGANGKSTLINLMKAFLGQENISAIPMQSLETDRFSIGHLYGKKANLYPDLSSKSMNQISKLKALTGGDMITAETKFGKHFNFTNYAKMVFSCNQLPAIKEDTMAVWRRWIVINFNQTFEGKKADHELLEKITTEEELSGLFNWALEGLKRIQINGVFTHNKSTDETRRHYIFNSDPVKAFCEDMIVEEHEAFISKLDLYNAFKIFCKENKLNTASETKFVVDLKSNVIGLGQERKGVQGARVYSWTGIRLKTKLEISEDLNERKQKNESIINEMENDVDSVHSVQGFLSLSKQSNLNKIEEEKERKVEKEKTIDTLDTLDQQKLLDFIKDWVKLSKVYEKFTLEFSQPILQRLLEENKVEYLGDLIRLKDRGVK